ncbi:hypothetical protein AeRB84_015109 [Aphanomyces euteiches]|nr:hypothetical protein AeRB84_015109 [Aphanomyces euteiches]
MTLLATDANLTIRLLSMHAFRIREADVTQVRPRIKSSVPVSPADFASYLMATLIEDPNDRPGEIVKTDLKVDGNGILHLFVATALPNGERVNGYVVDFVEQTVHVNVNTLPSEIVAKRLGDEIQLLSSQFSNSKPSRILTSLQAKPKRYDWDEAICWLTETNIDSQYLTMDATETRLIIMKSGVYVLRGWGHAESYLVICIGDKEHARTESSGAKQHLACVVRIVDVGAIKVRNPIANMVRSFELSIEEME